MEKETNICIKKTQQTNKTKQQQKKKQLLHSYIINVKCRQTATFDSIDSANEGMC